MVPGGGAVEMELSRQVESFSETCEGLEQYAVKRFANALQVVPRILAENTGKYVVAHNTVVAQLNTLLEIRLLNIFILQHFRSKIIRGNF